MTRTLFGTDIPDPTVTEVKEGEADFTRLMLMMPYEEREKCRLDHLMFGQCYIEVVDGKARRVPPEQHPNKVISNDR